MGLMNAAALQSRVLRIVTLLVVVASTVALFQSYLLQELPLKLTPTANHHSSSSPGPSSSSSSSSSPSTDSSVATKWPLTDDEPFEKAHELPADFFAASDYQKTCAKYFGVQYIETIARRGASFCEPGAPSSLVCFHATNLRAAGPFETDPVCVARGAAVSPRQDEHDGGAISVRMQCALRNFTTERLQSDEAALRLDGIKNIEKMSTYYFNTGAGPELRTWHFSEPGAAAPPPGAPPLACTEDQSDGKWYMLVPRESNNNVWHKLMEVWQATLSLNALWLARDPETGAPLMTQADRDGMQIVLGDEREEYMDPLWATITGRPPLRRRDMPACPGRVVLPMAGSSSPFWPFLLESNDHEPCRTRSLMDKLVAQTLAGLGIDPPRRETDVHFDPVVTIINRTRTRVFEDIDKHVTVLRQRNPNVTFNVVDFATLSLPDQARLVQSSDVLVGHHGAGMAHMLFLPPGAATVEIFPPPHRFPILGFRHVAFMRGLAHFVGHSVWKEEWDAAVLGVPLPADWNPPNNDAKWQSRPKSYVPQDTFVRLVEAAITNQRFKSPRVWH